MEMIQFFQESGVQVDHVQLHGIVQEDPHRTFIPAGSNEEVNTSAGADFPVASE